MYRYCTCFLSAHSETLNANIICYNVHSHVISSSRLPCELQMRMNVCKVLVTVIVMQVAPMNNQVIAALATLDSGVMDLLA